MTVVRRNRAQSGVTAARRQKIKILMAEKILMPRLSDTMTEGVIAAWHKNVGDPVKERRSACRN